MEAQKIAGRSTSQTHDAELTIIAGLVVFALFLRLPLLATLPASFSDGEAQKLTAALSLLAGHWPMSDDVGGLGPGLSTYVEALSLGILGANAAAARLPTALVGAFALAQFYQLARGRCRPLAALAASLLLAASVWSLNFSRGAWDYAWVVLYAILLAGAMARAEREEWPLFSWALAGALAGLALVEPPGGRWLALALAVYFPLAILVHRERFWRTVIGGTAALAAALAVVLALQIPHPEGPAVALGTALGSGAAQEGQHLLGRLISAGRAFVLVDGAALANPLLTPPGRPLFDTMTAALYLAGLFLAARRWREASLSWCFLLVPVTASALFDRSAVDLANVVAALPFAYLFVALALERLLALPPTRVGVLQIAALVLVAGAVLVNVADYYRWQTQPATAQARQPALPVEDVPAWAAAQAAALRGGPAAPTVAEWQRQRGRSLPSLPAPAQPLRRPTPAAAPPVLANLLLRLSEPGQISVPRGVAIAPTGEILVVDSGLARIQRFDEQGRFLGSLGGEVLEPFDIEVAPSGEIYVVDSQLGVVLKFSADGAPAGSLGSQLGAYRPRGLGLDLAGNLYVADTGRDRVLVLSPADELLLAIDRSAVPFQQPTDVAVDGEGNIYVADPVEQRLLKFGPDGRFLLDWGISATNTIDSPHLAVTAQGEVVVSDPAQHRLVVFSPDGQPLGALSPVEATGALKTPLGLTADSEGNVYVADKGDSSVKKYGWER